MLNRFKFFLKQYSMLVAISMTTVLCACAFLGAFLLRFDCGRIPDPHIFAMYLGLPFIVLIRMVALLSFRAHRGLYRYASLYDFIKLFKAISAGTVAFLVVWELTGAHHYVMPRSIYILDWILCMALLMGIRIGVRIWRTRYQIRPKLQDSLPISRALIVGAGDLGESVLRLVDRRFLGQEMHVVGFVDQDVGKQGSLIHGIPVFGKELDVSELVSTHDVEIVLFAISEPKKGLFESIVKSCDGLSVHFNTVSLLKDAVSGELSLNKIRDVRIEDLLGRSQVEPDRTLVMGAVVGRTVLVSGAGGSIGSELARQIASYKPRKLVLFEVGESPLFEIDRELRQNFPDLDVVPFIGDSKHADVVDRVFAENRPEFVYHAAAYKHVPLMEAHPDEAVLNNVRGTRILGETARRHGCKRFVMISTDKAVRPTNVMGATKSICELVIQGLNGGDTIFAAVRFGNVLGSNGSVIPIFRKQIEAGGPLTVTHPEITRYFMTIPEAVSLVLQCGVIAEPGDTFVLDMGTPMKIIDLARNMIRLSGLQEEVDVKIEVTGLRPGEKMYEELVAYGEDFSKTEVPKVNVLKKTHIFLERDAIMEMVSQIEDLALKREVEPVREFLWSFIRHVSSDGDAANFTAFKTD